MRAGSTKTRMAAMVAAGVLTAATVAGAASATPKDEAGEHKVTICHVTNSVTYPYVVITVDVAAWDGEGLNDHTHHEARDGRRDAALVDGLCPDDDGGEGGGGVIIGGVISGVVWDDMSGEGIRDGDEWGLGGVEVQLVEGDTVVQTAFTADNGTYSFGTNPGTYTIYFVTPDGVWEPTTQVQYVVDLDSGGTEAVNAGFRRIVG